MSGDDISISTHLTVDRLGFIISIHSPVLDVSVRSSAKLLQAMGRANG